MTLSQPPADDLIQAVEDFLTDTVMPQVDKKTAFHLKVSCHILEILRRELDNNNRVDEITRQALLTLLGESGEWPADHDEMPTASLNALLCDKIRSGSITQDDPGLIQQLRRITAARLSIDNPAYSGLNRPEPGQ